MARDNLDSFDATWEASDGYVGGSRPQSTRIRADEVDGYETENDLRLLFDELIQDDFNQKVSWWSKNQDAFVEWAKKVQKRMREDNEKRGDERGN